MNKLLRVVNVEMRPTVTGSFKVLLCLTDFIPESEAVDEFKERLLKIKSQVPESMGPAIEMFYELPRLARAGAESGDHRPHDETVKILMTSEEYESLGKPTVGQPVSITMKIEDSAESPRPRGPA